MSAITCTFVRNSVCWTLASPTESETLGWIPQICVFNPPEILLLAKVWKPVLRGTESTPSKKPATLRSPSWKDYTESTQEQRKMPNDPQLVQPLAVWHSLLMSFNISLNRYVTWEICCCVYVFFVYISSIVLTCFLHFSPNSIFSYISHHCMVSGESVISSVLSRRSKNLKRWMDQCYSLVLQLSLYQGSV